MNLHGLARLAFALAIASCLVMGVARADDDDDDAALTPVIPAYHDRIIPSQQLQRLPADDEEDAQVNTKGLPRTFNAEAFVSRTEIGKQNLDEEGFSIGGHWETPSWGSFSLDAALFNTSCGSSNGVGAFNHNTCGIGGSATLWQRSLYMPGGWTVNNGLGVLNTPAPPLQRNQYRFFLPTVTFVGTSTEWQQDGHLLLEGSIGRAGIYSGTHVPGFEIADGNVASLSAQWSWAPHWTGAASFLGTNGRIVPNDLGQNVFQQANTQAVYAGTAWQGAHDNVQLNVVNSNGDLGNATGAWIDASAIRGRYTSNYGAYRLDPGLAWGALPINKLLVTDADALVADVMTSDMLTLNPWDKADEAAQAFERYDLVSAPVVDADNKLIGRVTVNEVMDFIRDAQEEEMLSKAGLKEEEDIFAPISRSVKNRAPWLLLNLCTAAIASYVASRFEGTVSQIVMLAFLMSIVAGIGGNSGNQTMTLIIRALALGQITSANVRRLITKELATSVLIGVCGGLIAGVFAYAISHRIGLGVVMMAAMVLNLIVGATLGMLVPLIRYRMGRDPAVGSSVLLTFATDTMGFFIFLGLATLFLI